MGPDVHAKMSMRRCGRPGESADERCGPRRGHPARLIGERETGETKPYRSANVLSETIVLEKQLA
jgi:hypothetical protein